MGGDEGSVTRQGDGTTGNLPLQRCCWPAAADDERVQGDGLDRFQEAAGRLQGTRDWLEWIQGRVEGIRLAELEISAAFGPRSPLRASTSRYR